MAPETFLFLATTSLPVALFLSTTHGFRGGNYNCKQRLQQTIEIVRLLRCFYLLSSTRHLQQDWPIRLYPYMLNIYNLICLSRFIFQILKTRFAFLNINHLDFF